MLAIVVAAVAYLDMRAGAETGGGIAFYTVLSSVAVTLIARAFVWSAIVAGTHGVQVRSPLQTRRLSWAKVRDFRAEDRVVIVLADGREVRCWAVQRANIAGLLKRRSCVDDVVADLTRLHNEHMADSP
ncbi:PH domain-containing protein [Streptomyces vilmorinianum]|uniref:PH domain-containing protein n=1 Tax=Streptomyces vilmorinianum TaxID=3051092 RepID=UPI0020C7DB43|nr:PH domain-containing protein [Streptomyces vilmorinianum]